MMKSRQVYLARFYYTIAKCTCQEVLQKNIKSKVICPRSLMERGRFIYMIEIFIKMWYNKETQPEVYIKKRLIGGMFSSAMLQ